tara:strand:- start:870 stop:1109 length:240 start_codon:yes stop_codon:yes gene_type:complete
MRLIRMVPLVPVVFPSSRRGPSYDTGRSHTNQGFESVTKGGFYATPHLCVQWYTKKSRNHLIAASGSGKSKTIQNLRIT